MPTKNPFLLEPLPSLKLKPPPIPTAGFEPLPPSDPPTPLFEEAVKYNPGLRRKEQADPFLKLPSWLRDFLTQHGEAEHAQDMLDFNADVAIGKAAWESPIGKGVGEVAGAIGGASDAVAKKARGVYEKYVVYPEAAQELEGSLRLRQQANTLVGSKKDFDPNEQSLQMQAFGAVDELKRIASLPEEEIVSEYGTVPGAVMEILATPLNYIGPPTIKFGKTAIKGIGSAAKFVLNGDDILRVGTRAFPIEDILRSQNEEIARIGRAVFDMNNSEEGRLILEKLLGQGVTLPEVYTAIGALDELRLDTVALVNDTKRLASIMPKQQGWLDRMWHPIKVLTFEPLKKKLPQIVEPYIHFGRMAQVDMMRQGLMATTAVHFLKLTFGDLAVRGKELTSVPYKGSRQTPFIGQLRDIIAHPEEYSLTGDQQKAIRFVNILMEQSYDDNIAVGIQMAQREKNYFPNRARQKGYTEAEIDERLLNTIEGKSHRSPAFKGLEESQREREFTYDEFVDRLRKDTVINNIAFTGQELDTDVERLLFDRLLEDVTLRADYGFVNAVLKNLELDKASITRITKRGKLVPDKKKIAELKTRSRVVPALGGKERVYSPDDLVPIVNPRTGKVEVINPYDEMLELLTPLVAPPDVSQVEAFIDDMRALVLNFDFGVILRQGANVMMADPVSWAKGMRDYQRGVAGNDIRWVTWVAENYGGELGLRNMMLHGLTFAQSAIDISDVAHLGEKSVLRYSGKYITSFIQDINKRQFQRLLPMFKANLWRHTYTMLKDSRDNPTHSVWKNVVQPWKILLPLNTKGRTDDELAEIASRHVISLTGGIEWQAMDKNRAIVQKALFLAPGWTRSQVGLVMTALSPKAGPEQQLARRMLLQQYAMVTAANVLFQGSANALINDDRRDENYDPFDFNGQHWGSFRVGDVWASPLPQTSLWRGIFRSMFSTVQGVTGQKEPEVAGEEVLSILDQFMGGRTSPMLSMAKEQVTSKDYYGRPLDVPGDLVETVNRRAENVMRNFSPIFFQTMAEVLTRADEPQGSLLRFTLDSLGVSNNFMGYSDYRNDVIKTMSKDNGFFTAAQLEEWSKTGNPPRWGLENGSDEKPHLLEPRQKRIIEARPDVRLIQEVTLKGTEGWNNAELRRQALEKARKEDRELLGPFNEENGKWSGKVEDWRAALQETSAAMAGVMARQRAEDALTGRKYRPPTTQAGKDYEKYLNVIIKWVDPITGKPSNDEVQQRMSQELDMVFAGLPEDSQEYILRNLHSNTTDIRRDYFDAQRQLADYFKLKRSFTLPEEIAKNPYIKDKPKEMWLKWKSKEAAAYAKDPQAATFVERYLWTSLMIGEVQTLELHKYLERNPDKVLLINKWYPDYNSSATELTKFGDMSIAKDMIKEITGGQ